ncbi:MAG TPA: DUF3606 domain-containing protein [Bryobacteraceae bacterium]|nr:DUF3606 domain-containing protein [Bryobacteraceae bacterium]
MADNLNERGAQDRARINMNEEWEVRYWTTELGISEEELRTIVQKVGPSAEAVRREATGRGRAAGA